MYFALHAEKWLSGSTRTELEHDERACFIDIVARAAPLGADAPGEIRFVNAEQLAMEVRVPLDLLKRTLEKCEKFKKIKIYENRKQKIEILRVLNWEKYQHPYLHQRNYRLRQRALRESQNAGTNNDNRKITRNNRDITGYGDRIGEDTDKNDDIIVYKDINTKLSISPAKRNFLNRLKELSKDPKTPYPFNPVKDGLLYDQVRAVCPNTDLLAELDKKIDYWRSENQKYPMNRAFARRQLLTWFKKEEDFQIKEHGLA